jgi:hypothetical protein
MSTLGISLMHRLAITALAATLTSIACAATAQQGWQQHTIAERGFKVAMPAKPQRRDLALPSRDGTLTVYESIEASNPPAKYSVFVGAPTQQGIFEPDSIDAYLTGHVASMVRAADSGKLLTTSRTTFRGRPALEYEFSHRLEGIPYIGRGITMMIDGGHIRVSMWHPSSDSKAKDKYRRFVESFELVPIQFSAAPARFADTRGITFSPPNGWLAQAGPNPVQVVRYTNLTRSLQLLVAGVPTYTCDNFLAEVRASGRFKEAGSVKFAERPATRILSFEDVPKYNVRLTTVQYCQNSRFGAVVLGGSEEEAMFARWAGVYEGAAATLQVP